MADNLHIALFVLSEEILNIQCITQIIRSTPCSRSHSGKDIFGIILTTQELKLLLLPVVILPCFSPEEHFYLHLKRKVNQIMLPFDNRRPDSPQTPHGSPLNEMPSRYVSSGGLRPFGALQKVPASSQQASTAVGLVWSETLAIVVGARQNRQPIMTREMEPSALNVTLGLRGFAQCFAC